jgi:hypothetical protein
VAQGVKTLKSSTWMRSTGIPRAEKAGIESVSGREAALPAGTAKTRTLATGTAAPGAGAGG